MAGTQGLSQSAWAAITKHHRLRGFNNRNLFSHSPRLKSEIKVPFRVGFLGGAWLASRCAFAWPILGVCGERESGVRFSSCKGIGPIGLEPHPMPSLNLHYLCKKPSFKYSCIEGGVKASTYEFCEG